MGFHGETLLKPRPTPQLEDHPLSAVRYCLFNIFAATLHIGGHSSIRNLMTRHAVVTGTHLSRKEAKHTFWNSQRRFQPSEKNYYNGEEKWRRWQRLFAPVVAVRYIAWSWFDPRTYNSFRRTPETVQWLFFKYFPEDLDKFAWIRIPFTAKVRSEFNSTEKENLTELFCDKTLKTKLLQHERNWVFDIRKDEYPLLSAKAQQIPIQFETSSLRSRVFCVCCERNRIPC
jgi:hypothetical protein